MPPKKSKVEPTRLAPYEVFNPRALVWVGFEAGVYCPCEGGRNALVRAGWFDSAFELFVAHLVVVRVERFLVGSLALTKVS